MGPAENFDHVEMSVEQMKENGGLIVDIRTPAEWAETGVIEGARLVTFQDPQDFLDAVWSEIEDGRDLLLVCRSGGRTAAAGQYLAPMIPNRVVSVAGGMINILAGGYSPVAPEL